MFSTHWPNWKWIYRTSAARAHTSWSHFKTILFLSLRHFQAFQTSRRFIFLVFSSESINFRSLLMSSVAMIIFGMNEAASFISYIPLCGCERDVRAKWCEMFCLSTWDERENSNWIQIECLFIQSHLELRHLGLCERVCLVHLKNGIPFGIQFNHFHKLLCCGAFSLCTMEWWVSECPLHVVNVQYFEYFTFFPSPRSLLERANGWIYQMKI